MKLPYTRVGTCRLTWVRQTLRLDAFPYDRAATHYRVMLANPQTGAAVQWWHSANGQATAADIMAAIGMRNAQAESPTRFANAHPDLTPDVARRVYSNEARLARAMKEITRPA